MEDKRLDMPEAMHSDEDAFTGKYRTKQQWLEHWHIIALLVAIYDLIAVNGAYIFALWLRFDCVFSENYFDITNPSPYRIKIETNRCKQCKCCKLCKLCAEELKKNLRIKSVYDIR